MSLEVNSYLAAPDLLELVRCFYEGNSARGHTSGLQKNQLSTGSRTSIDNVDGFVTCIADWILNVFGGVKPLDFALSALLSHNSVA
jgi:hypothetical protein